MGKGRRAAAHGSLSGGKPGRRTTTQTPGSSGTRPSAVAVWVGYPNGSSRWRRSSVSRSGAHAARADLEGVHDPRLSKQKPTRSPTSPSFVRPSASRSGRQMAPRPSITAPARVIRTSRVASWSTAACSANRCRCPCSWAARAVRASSALGSVPLTPDVSTSRPSHGRVRTRVVKRKPRGGFLSANGTVRPVTATHDGLVPNLVRVEPPRRPRAKPEAEARLRVHYGDGPSGTVVQQSLEAGIASEPGCR